ncbi:hypothetical protein [Flavobacterium alvei]|nr:hypothetical protein [Flavobacterium alvei]
MDSLKRKLAFLNTKNTKKKQSSLRKDAIDSALLALVDMFALENRSYI